MFLNRFDQFVINANDGIINLEKCQEKCPTVREKMSLQRVGVVESGLVERVDSSVKSLSSTICPNHNSILK